MATHSSNLCGILSETKRIINAHSRHFLALSLLFLLPLSFSSIIYSSIWQPTSILSTYTQIPSAPPIDDSRIVFHVIYSLVVLLFSILATASITHSTFNGFYGRPVKLASSIKSALFSFFPLLVTLIVTVFALGTVCVVYGCLAVLLYNGLAFSGVEIDYDSVYFIISAVLIVLILIGILIYIQIEWNLANVVVVVESKWGVKPLKRSSYLIKGMKTVAFWMIILFGLLFVIWSKLCSSLSSNAGGNGVDGGWISWALIVVLTALYAASMTIIMLYSVAANTVLFMHCKALRGELAFDIVEEFARDYVSLPFDDGKVPHVVYVV